MARRIVDELSGLLASIEARRADYEHVGGHPEWLEQRVEGEYVTEPFTTAQLPSVIQKLAG